MANALKGGLERTMVQQDGGNHVEREEEVVVGVEEERAGLEASEGPRPETLKPLVE